MEKPAIALVVGHHPDAPNQLREKGPYAEEFEFNDALAKSIMEQYEKNGYNENFVIHLKYRPRPTYSSVKDTLVPEINSLKVDCVVSLHSNASTHNAKGSVALHWPTSGDGKKLALSLVNHVADALRIRNRGAVGQDRSWAGTPYLKGGRWMPGGPYLWILKSTKMPATILESHFMTSDSDHKAAIKGLESGKLGKAVLDGILDYFKQVGK